jgi:uncharacterized protein YdeI (YjbR/CyaY-like superfamily)
VPEQILFASRVDFRKWLEENCLSDDGAWLVFGKSGGPKSLKAAEALEEALCFGWIDGQIESIDDKTYKKYFIKRRKKSKWSEKNKKLVNELELKGLMTGYGLAKVEEAKQSGMWDAPKSEPFTEEHMHMLEALIKDTEPAYSNFMAMTPSVKRGYVGSYFSIKTEDGRKKRLAVIIERLNKNLNPMESMKV